MQIQKSQTINCSAASLWEIIGSGYAEVDRWASNVFLSKPLSGRLSDTSGPVGGRVCETSQGTFEEIIVDFDKDARRVAYSVSGKSVPGFVRSILAKMTVSESSLNSCQIRMEMDADISAPFNILFGWMMKAQFGKAIDETLEELKFFAETGNKHARKIEATKSKAAQKILSSVS